MASLPMNFVNKNEYECSPAFYSIFATVAKVESFNNDRKIFIPGKLSIGHSSTVFSDFYEVFLANFSTSKFCQLVAPKNSFNNKYIFK